VRVATVQARNMPLTNEWIATLDGSTTAQIQPQVTGYIVAVNYHEGSLVQQGELLFTLEKRPFVAAVQKARGDYQEAVAGLNKARADVARYAPLVAQTALSKEQLDNARAAVLEGEGKVASTKAALDSALINLEWTEVRSPIQGLVGLAQTRVGSLVSPNQVLTIVSTIDPMRASFHVSQQDYLQYAEAFKHPNAPERIQQRYFELILVNDRSYPFRARNVVVNRQIESTTGTLEVQAFFPNPDGLLRPGLSGKVRVHSGTTAPVPIVPERAVTELQGRYQITVLDDQQRVQLRPLEVGRLVDHEYLVHSGVRPGERVVVEGQQMLIPGTKVKVAPSEQPRPVGGASGGVGVGGAGLDGGGG
jgi:membrane fusion protein (multidrug efflux system)